MCLTFYFLYLLSCRYYIAQITVIAGSRTLDVGGQRYALDDYISHPQYIPSLGQNDISLLKTENNIVFGDLVSSIPIASGDVGAGFQAVLSGWGTTYLNGPIPNFLQYLNVSTVSNSECAERHEPAVYPITESNICSFSNFGEGACHGDSGGPLAVQNILVGIVSWGHPCAKGYPDVFTRVSSYVDWILENAT